MFNIVATVLALLVVLVLAYLAFVKTKAQGTELIESGGRTLVGLLDIVKEEISELVKDDSFTGTTELEFRNLLSRKAKIIATIRDATDGKDSSKEIVIDLIYNIVTKHCPEEQDLLNVVPFISTSSLTPHIKFEILMYHFKKILTEENLRKPPEDRVSNPERNAFKAWVKKYDLARPKYIIEDGTKASYAITVEEVEDTYEKEDIALSYTDMAHILAVLIFQKYKGFGCIDTLRAQDINGLTLGTSGSILTYLRDQQFTATQSIWCNFGGRYVHCRFLDFVTHEELRRVVQLLARYNSPGPLTERRGYIVNNMYDESRILAVRPPFAESWGAFIRKFGADHKTLHFLIYKDYITGWELPLDMIKHLMRGQVTTSFTGRQGSGKTTMMTSAIEYMDPRHNLRIIEMAFEMNVREHYPERNVMTLQETEFLAAHHAQDAQKKSDGAVALFGEVATDTVAARMIQAGKVASLFTIFSHHGKTAEDTVYALADSVMAATGAKDRAITEQSVIDVLRIDVHLDFTADGKYFVERITEIIQEPRGVPYPEIDVNNLELSKVIIDREYYTRTTDRRTFITKDIVKYDLETDTYRAVNMLSDNLLAYMLNCMDKTQQTEFKEFLGHWFGFGHADSDLDERSVTPLKSEIKKDGVPSMKTGLTRDALLRKGV